VGQKRHAILRGRAGLIVYRVRHCHQGEMDPRAELKPQFEMP